MEKVARDHILVLSIAITGATPTLALAQSSVTLYGIVDAGVSYVNNVAVKPGSVGASKFQETTGVGLPSRWGIRGIEDLGGGNSAVFVLENGFSVANGTMLQGSRLFGRQAYVGLQNNAIGTFSMGRQYEPLVDFVGPFVSSRQWGTQYGAHVGDVDNLYTTFRLNNTVKFESKNFAGFTLGGLYAFSNQAAGSDGEGFANNRAWSVGGSYARNSLSLGVAHFHLSEPSAGATGGSNTSGAVVGDYSSTTSIFYARPVSTQDITGGGIAYEMSQFTIGGAYTFVKLRYADHTNFSISNYEVNGRYRFTPALQAGVAVIYSVGNVGGASSMANVSDGPHPHWLQFNSGLVYSLSKLTDLYGAVVYQKALNGALTTAINNIGGSSGTNSRYQIAATAGVRHRF
ncbi:Outer membrane porin protein [Paraburkholderia hiiakae]|uniref:Outer membrane porin protein n=1 Tax=Paraburkholderia hiiakae TaxID=1081782 RepID=A0ABM8NZ71_9BURK|nr:porin [Paraburkholderia hiiakae]CAD6550444.1 Outer membrane porin protein [Paraburkholderia hiiakae]